MSLINYYMPRLKRQLIFYPVIAVLFYFLMFFTLRWEGVILISAIASNILNVMLYLGALIFASRGGMEIDTMLPVDWRKKATLILVHTFIIVPLLIALPVAVCYLLTSQWIVINPFIKGILQQEWLLPLPFIIMSIATTMLPMAVCLYCVVSLKSNRVIMSIVWTIVAAFAESIVGGIYGAYAAFKQGIEDGLNGVEPQSSTELAKDLMAEISNGSTAITVIFAICTIFVIVMACRAIKTRQI